MDDLRGGDVGFGGSFRTDGPEGGNPGCTGEAAPFFGEIDVEEGFAGALVAGFAVFEGEERGVADEECGIGCIEHGIEIGGVRFEGRVGFPEVVKKNARVCGGGTRGGVEGDAANVAQVAILAGDEEDGADVIAGCDGASGDDEQAGLRGVGGDGDETDVGLAGGEFGGADGGCGPGDLVACSEFLLCWWVLEVPHERGGVEEGDGSNAELHSPV